MLKNFDAQLPLPAPAREVFNFLTLSLLTRSKYAALLYDAGGGPVHAFNLDRHVYRVFVSALSRQPVFENFNIPVVENLNALFEEKTNPRLAALAFEPEFDSLLKEAGSLQTCYYESKNILENASDVTRFIAAPPLSRIHLYRLSENLFLGLVSLSELSYRVAAFEDFRAVVTDVEGRIAGYSGFLPALLKTSGSRGLLGQALSEILDIDHPLDPAWEEKTAGLHFETLCDWRAGEAPEARFELPSAGAAAKVSASSQGLRLENSSGSEYGFLFLKAPVDADRHHLTLEWEFENDGGTLPGLILRGSGESDATLTPDGEGYNFSTYDSHEKSFLFKKGGVPVFAAPRPPLSEGRPWRLSLRKYFDAFDFSAGGRALGQWTDPAPYRTPSEQRLCLFLRPGTRALLRAFRLRTAPLRGARAPEARKTLPARLRAGKNDYFFSVSLTSRVWDGKYFNLYLLDDVTSFKKSIHSLEKEKSALVSLLREEHSLMGRSPRILELRKTVDRVAQTSLTVLIEGETGAGKEVLARAIHQAGPRRDKPFVKIDCAMFPESLMESELFGHEKGAFTGATEARPGRLEQAQGGIVFLDEIANLSMGVQAKLLGVLQDFKIQRIGGTKIIPLDIRLIAASNVPLKQLISQGRFREDLFYRLNQWRVVMPPLRERPEDIPLLAEVFLREANGLYGKSVPRFSEAALRKLCLAPWTGNVRELRSVVLRAALLCEEEEIEAGQIVLENESAEGPLPKGKPGDPARRKKIDVDRKTFERLARKERGNINRIAHVLRLSRPSVYKLTKVWRLDLGKLRRLT